jgi:hypothetical protein
MKLRYCLCSSFYHLQLLANFARPRRTLSASKKNQPQRLAITISASTSLASTSLFLLPAPLSAIARSSQSFIQTPNYP